MDDLGSPVRFVDEAYGYDEFGQALHQHTSNQPFAYTGYQIDPIAGLTLSPSRAYSPELGCFTSADTHWHTENMVYGDTIKQVRNASLLPNPSAIRQSSNLYEYGLSNPNKYVDPLGKDVWLVHGTTFRDDDPNAGLGHWQPNGSTGFTDNLNKLFNQTINYDFSWAGGNSKGDRLAGAEDLVAQIRDAHLSNPNEPIRIVGYSHGGNVAILAVNELWTKYGIEVDTLITIGTPSRSDYKVIRDGDIVGQHINVYNSRDGVQIIGGTDFPTSGQDSRGWWTRMSNNYFGLARRTQPSAINKEVLTGRGGWSDLFGDNHKFMHNDWDIWLQYIIPELENSKFDLNFLNGCS